MNRPTVFALDDCIVAEEDSFVYTEGMDEGWQTVRAGQLVGQYESGREVYIEKDGMFVFPKAAHEIERCKSLYYIAVQLR